MQGCLDPAEGQELEGPSTVRKIGKGSSVPLPTPSGTRGWLVKPQTLDLNVRVRAAGRALMAGTDLALSSHSSYHRQFDAS